MASDDAREHSWIGDDLVGLSFHEGTYRARGPEGEVGRHVAGPAFAPRIVADDFDVLVFVREPAASDPVR